MLRLHAEGMRHFGALDDVKIYRFLGGGFGIVFIVLEGSLGAIFPSASAPFVN